MFGVRIENDGEGASLERLVDSDICPLLEYLKAFWLPLRTSYIPLADDMDLCIRDYRFLHSFVVVLRTLNK